MIINCSLLHWPISSSSLRLSSFVRFSFRGKSLLHSISTYLSNLRQAHLQNRPVIIELPLIHIVRRHHLDTLTVKLAQTGMWGQFIVVCIIGGVQKWSSVRCNHEAFLMDLIELMSLLAESVSIIPMVKIYKWGSPIIDKGSMLSMQLQSSPREVRTGNRMWLI